MEDENRNMIPGLKGRPMDEDEKAAIQEAMELLPGGVILFENDGEDITLLLGNRGFFALAPKASQGAGQGLLEHVAAEDRELLAQRIRLAAWRDAPFDCQYRAAGAGGEVRWLNLQAVPLPGAKGRPTRFSAIVTDVTPFKQAELALTNSKRQLEHLLAKLPCGLLVVAWEPPIRLLYASDALFDIINMTREELEKGFLGRPMSPSRRELLDSLNKAVEAARRGEEPADIHHSSRSNKTPRIYQFRVRTVDPAGRWVMVLAMDVTRQYDMELSLKMLGEQFKLALSMTSALVCNYDFATRRALPTPGVFQHYGHYFPISGKLPEAMIQSGMVHPDSVKDVKGLFRRLRIRGRAEAALRLRRADGSYGWEKVSYSTVYDREGQPYQAVGIFNDITEFRETQEKVEMEEQYRAAVAVGARLSFTANLSRDLLLEVDHNPPEIEVPRGYSNMVSQVLEGCVMLDYQDKFRAFADRERLINAFSEGSTEVSMDLPCSGGERVGEYRWHSFTAHLFQGRKTGDICGFFYLKNCDARKRQELMLQESAQRDPLTGLYNRATLQLGVEQALNRERKGSTMGVMMMIDLDDFKQINDVLGHQCGDRALMLIAGKLKAMFRSGDLVGRVGGDEFMVYLERIPGREFAFRRAEETLSALNVEVGDNRCQLALSCSIGLAFFPEDGNTFQELYKSADGALYRAKETGKNTYQTAQGSNAPE